MSYAFLHTHICNIYIYTYIYAYVYVYRSPGKWLGVSVSVAYESGPCGILRTRRVRICMCVSWLFCCPRCGRMARRSTFSSRSLILFFHPSSSISRIGLSVISLYRVRVSYIHAIPFLRDRTVSQDLFASRWLPTKLVRNASIGSHSSNDKRHRADRVSVLLLLLLLFFFGYRMFKIHAAFLYIYNIYVSRSQSSRSRVPSHRTIPPPLFSFLRLFTPPERVPRTLLAHESLYTRSI